MRPSFLLTLGLVLSGCGQKQPLTVHYKPVSYWVEALHHADVRLRLKAVGALGNVGSLDPAAISALAGAVKDGDPQVRAAAVLALLRIGPDAREAVEVLTAALQDDEPQVREYAAKALARIRDSR